MVMKNGNPSVGEVKKRVGTKRKIKIEKIADQAKLAVAYSKRSGGLHSKASQLCLLDGSQIAIIASPPSSESAVSFNSFAHASVHSIVSAYLSGTALGPVPAETLKEMREEVAVFMVRKDLGLGFWWEHESIDSSTNLDELRDTLGSMSKLKMGLEGLHAEVELKTNDSLLPQDPNFAIICQDQEMDFDELIDYDTPLDLESLVSGGLFESFEEMDDFASSFLMGMDPLSSDSQFTVDLV